MPRRIRTAAYQAAGTGGKLDGYFDRIIKYIPADVVGAWVAANGFIGSPDASDPNRTTVGWIVFVVGAVAAAAWTWKQTSEPGKPTAIVQIVMATAAFIVWVFALGGPFKDLPWYRDAYGSLLLIGFTLFAGLITPKE